jgi:transcriptional regulator of arginine metabolism
MQKKTGRQQKLAELIDSENFAYQENLLKAIRAAGFDCTQATLSRDLSGLGVRKVRRDGGVFYTLTTPSVPTILAAGINSVKTAASIIVIACEAGAAPAVCVRLDSMNIPEAVGTIAGDDTIFIACESADAAKKLTQKLQNLLNISR